MPHLVENRTKQSTRGSDEIRECFHENTAKLIYSAEPVISCVVRYTECNCKKCHTNASISPCALFMDYMHRKNFHSLLDCKIV